MPIRAAVMTAPEQPIEVWEIDDPAMEDGSVVLETVASEVCGTDVHLHHGRLAGVPYPIIPGHVSVGRVLALRGVHADALGQPLGIGDLATFYDVTGVCNACWFCTVAKQPNRCPNRKVYGIGFTAAEGPLGGWAERIYLKPGVRIIKLPSPLTSDDVIGGGCGLFTGFAAVERSDLAMGDVVVIQGSGPVGLSAAAFARLRGAGRVVSIGAPEARLRLARKLGADDVLSIEQHTAQERMEWVMALSGRRGADVVIEASGNPKALPEGFALLRDGGTYVIAGHYTDAGEIAINPHREVNRPHIDVRGQWGTDFRHLVRGLTMFAKHHDRLPFAEVIGGRYGLDRAGQALADVASLRVTKAIIEPGTS